MKLKSLPGDFQVTELSRVTASGGPFALYQLEKESLGTPEAIHAILQHWNLPRHRISYGGMKDRHAQTTQWITIQNGPRQDLRERSFQLLYQGQTGRAFTPHDILGNRFAVRLRGIEPSARPNLDLRLQLIRSAGVVNYFDDQRFGSLGQSGRFIAQPWCRGQYEQALYLALAESNSHDRQRERQQKEILRECWGKWDLCKQRLDRSHRRSIVTYLVDHPQDFKRAIALLRSDLRSIYVAAFQSGLWNRWLSRIIQQRFGSSVWHLPSLLGPLAVPQFDSASEEQVNWMRGLRLPLPSARQHEWPAEETPLLDEILQQYDLQRREIRLKYPRDTFFSKGVRSGWLCPSQLRFEWQPDDAHAGKQALLLSFELPPGSYATMIIKMLQS